MSIKAMFLTLPLLFAIANLAWAGTLDCSVHNGFHQNKKILIQTAFAEDDEEENSEAYELIYDHFIKAYVSYLPYQTGVDLYLESIDKSVATSANFDMEEDDYMDLELKINGMNYTLTCRKSE